MGDFRTTYQTGTRGRALSLYRARRAGSLVLAGALAFTLAAAPATVPAPAFAASAAASLPATVQNAAYAKADATQAADIAAIEQSYTEKYGAQAAGTKALSDYLAGRDVATDSFMKIDASWLSSACAGKSAYAQALAKDVAAQHAKIAKIQAQADQSASSSTSSSSSSTTQGAGSSTASSASCVFGGCPAARVRFGRAGRSPRGPCRPERCDPCAGGRCARFAYHDGRCGIYQGQH